MEDLQEVARLILLQVDHNRECGKDDKFTKDEIADIINRRVVKKLNEPAVSKCDSIEREATVCTHPREHRAYIGRNTLRCGLCGLEFE